MLKSSNVCVCVCVATGLWHCVTGVTMFLSISHEEMGQIGTSHSIVPYALFKKKFRLRSRYREMVLDKHIRRGL